MSERLISLEKRKALSLVAITGLGFSALSGCSSVPLDEYSPVERVSFDLGRLNNAENSPITEDCLKYTAYDVRAGEYGRANFTPPAVSYDKSTDILTITPIQGDELRLTDFNQYDEMVSAADTESQAILNAYECVHHIYAVED